MSTQHPITPPYQDKLDRLMALNADDGEPIVLPSSLAVLARWGNYPVRPDSSPANTISQEDYDRG